MISLYRKPASLPNQRHWVRTCGSAKNSSLPSLPLECSTLSAALTLPHILTRTALDHPSYRLIFAEWLSPASTGDGAGLPCSGTPLPSAFRFDNRVPSVSILAWTGSQSERCVWLRVMPSRNIFFPSEFCMQNPQLPIVSYKERPRRHQEKRNPHQDLNKSQ